jgi:hypothetical protein
VFTSLMSMVNFCGRHDCRCDQNGKCHCENDRYVVMACERDTQVLLRCDVWQTKAFG